MAMSREELIALASPPCHECGEPVQRVELTYETRGNDPGWWPVGYMVCVAGHRVLVEQED